MKVRCLALAAICALLSVSAVQAHHSHGNYDTTVWTTMEGKVTELHLLVPHSWLYVEVKDAKGESTVWAIEATGFGGLQRVGIKREDVKPGDTVKVRCHLLRDGSNGCLLGVSRKSRNGGLGRDCFGRWRSRSDLCRRHN